MVGCGAMCCGVLYVFSVAIVGFYVRTSFACFVAYTRLLHGFVILGMIFGSIQCRSLHAHTAYMLLVCLCACVFFVLC